MNLPDFQSAKQVAEAGINFILGALGMCCGHITVAQCTNAASFIANVGGAILVLIQLYRTLRRKSRKGDEE